MLNLKILIISGAPIWVIFQNPVTYAKEENIRLLPYKTFIHTTDYYKMVV